eukprot:TRINITY_DN47290_c0_g1_i1.p1 TRINITY_DN47290_c0_g1~~TRINITY_DN47290_c0_g1_i1.p1  ORF type:complete len:505 (-),score=99.90 TRINITY_DN47290_c0_g1_i1:70-1542(-)
MAAEWTVRLRCQASAWLLVLTALALRGGLAKKKAKDGNSTMIAISRHSFQAPLQHQELLDEWLVSGASIFERDRLLLHPAIPQRYGFLWSRHPLKTGNFEVIVHLKVTGPKRAESFDSDQSIGLWFVEENVASNFDEPAIIKSESWKAGMDSAGFTFAGAKSKFKGIGAVLTMMDAEKRARPVVSFVSNDLTTDLAFGRDVPSSSAKPADFRNTLNAAQLRLRISPEVVEGHFKQSPSLSWNELFRIDRAATKTVTVPETGFLGITAWSGSKTDADSSDHVSIEKVEVYNADENVIGEEMKDVAANIQEAYREMLTDKNRHFVDQRSQMEHLNRLTTMISEHLTESSPIDASMFEQLSNLNSRMSKLEENCRTLSTEFAVLVNPAGKAGAGELKSHIKGLREMLVKGGEGHTKKLDDVSKTIKEVKAKHVATNSASTLNTISDQSAYLEKTVSSRSSQMSSMLFLLIGCVVVIGLLMYNRMHYYEKKHFI